MEQQVLSEIDDLFRELIVEKITKRINDVNDSLDSLLGEESEIRYKLNQIPSNGAVKSIVSAQLKDLKEQAEDITVSLNTEKQRLNDIENQVGKWLLQLAQSTKSQIDDSEQQLKDYSDAIESSILDRINGNAIDVENKVLASLENIQASITSDIVDKTDEAKEHLDTLLVDDQSEASFRRHFNSSCQVLSEKISDCQDFLEKINASIGEISTNIAVGNTCMEETKSAVSGLLEKSNSFAQKSDIAELQKAVNENAMRISTISNTDVLEELKQYKIYADARFDHLKKCSLFLILMNVLTLLTLFSLIALSLFK